MKISPIQNFSDPQNISKSHNNKFSAPKFYCDNQVRFKGRGNCLPTFEQYKRAKDLFNTNYNSMYNYDILADKNLSKYEGLQYGIKIFEGMTLKEVLFTCKNLKYIIVKNGCNRVCGHCYLAAEPKGSTMSWEDFKSITTGFKTLKERVLNSDIFNFKKQLTDNNRLIYLFHDSDCMDIVTNDKFNNKYNFIDFANVLYESLNTHTLFDTSGWYRNNLALQHQAEKYARYYSKPENLKPLSQFNYSLNPFNVTYIASVNALERGDIQKADILKERFINDAANVLYTFTPISKSDKFGIITRVLPDQFENSTHFNKTDFEEIIDEIFIRLKNLYKQDFSGSRNIIKNKSDIKIYIENIRSKMHVNSFGLFNSGRLEPFLQKRNINKSLFSSSNLDLRTQIIRTQYNDMNESFRTNCYKIIDTDGRVYGYHNHADYTPFPTSYQLNLEANNTTIRKIFGLQEDMPL